MEKLPTDRPCFTEERRRRAALIARLGGVCQDGFCFETSGLEFDHVYDRDWDPARISRLQRIARYEIEADAGIIRLLCKAHNASDGSKRRWVKRKK